MYFIKESVISNIVLESDTLFRYMVWDEENRLTCLTDDSYRSIYTYNHAGERVVKSHGPTESAYINGALQGVIHHNENTYTIYVNPFLVQTAQGFTKHIYNGNTRIATKLGTGEFKNRFVQDNYTQTAGNKDYIQKLNAIEHSREAYVKGHNTPPGVPTQKGLTGDVEFIAEAYPVVEFGNYDIPEGWENALAKPTQTGVPAQWENPNTTGFESSSEEETNLYFFHTDHLGSTNYLTDKDGVVQQSIVYQPYGEVLYEEKTYSNPYKFNGKELDTETGLAYYGARYYAPELGVWYGVDPLMEKYPQNGAYVFCNANPVKFVDMDGRKSNVSPFANSNIREAQSRCISEDSYVELRPSETNPDWQDAVLIYKDSEGNKQEQYFYATANNQKSWIENFDDYSNHDYHNAAQSDADFAEEAGPYAKGAALLLSPIGLVNDVVSLKTGKDIYGNNVDEMGKMISFLDIATLGMSKMGWMKTLKSASTVEGLKRTNSLTTLFSVYSTIKTEFEKEK